MGTMRPMISKIYCSSSQTVLVVRRRPHVVNGGGFVVTDCSTQKVFFRVDGCEVLGTGEVIVKDGKGKSVLLIRRKGGMVQALSLHRKWKGYAFDYEGSQMQVFTLEEPNTSLSCLVRNNNIAIRITSSFTTETTTSSKHWNNFEILGHFPDRDCSIVDSIGNNVVAQTGLKKEIEELMPMAAPTGSASANKDLYHVVVKPGMDQAFVIGVIATLDYIYGESTMC